MTWQPAKTIKHRSTAAYNCHSSHAGEPLFLVLLLAPRPKSDNFQLPSSNMAGPQRSASEYIIHILKDWIGQWPFHPWLEVKGGEHSRCWTSLSADIFSGIVYMIYIPYPRFISLWQNTWTPKNLTNGKSLWIPLSTPQVFKRVFLSASISWVTLAVSSTFLACHPVGKYPIEWFHITKEGIPTHF